MLKPFIIAGILLWSGLTCSRKAAVNEALVMVAPPLKDTVDFTTSILPILKTRCTPCHFPGGSMYGRLPFDNPRTILDHPAGVFKRIKDPEEVKKLRAFMEQSAPSGG